MPRPFHRPWVCLRKNTWRRVQITRLLTEKFSQASCFMYFRSKHPSEHPVVQHARSRFYRYARNLALGSYIQRVIPNVETMWLTLLFRIREVPGSNLEPETFYPEWGKCQDRIQIRPGRFLPHPFHFITDQSFFHSKLYSLSYWKTSESCVFLVLSNW
jgi:hypothetical protein